MKFNNVNFVRFLSMGGSLSHSAGRGWKFGARRRPMYTDLTQIDNFTALSGAKPTRSTPAPPPPRRESTIRGDIYDDAVTPTVENGKRLRALRGDSTTKVLQWLGVRHARP